MPTSVKEMLASANAVVPKITHADAQKMIADGNALVVDVRDEQRGAAGEYRRRDRGDLA